MSPIDGWFKVPVRPTQPECCGGWEVITCMMCGREAFSPPALLIVDEDGDIAVAARGPDSKILCGSCIN